MAAGVSVEQGLPRVAAGSAGTGTTAAPEKLASASGKAAEIDEARWRIALRLPCLLTVDLPLPNFKLADFLKVQRGSVIATNWHVSRDVPLRINGTLIGWSEFEVVGNRLAVRLTELA
jgi:flagellar motor switch/type III secretory pathway protein FliN